MRLFLCEKPSQAKDIARVVGANQRGEGCYTGSGLAVSWCIGHLVEAAPPERYGAQYKSWSIEHLPIIPRQWRVEAKQNTAAQFKAVTQLIARAGELIIATDADREGEMIARELLDLCNYHGPVYRLWLAALNDASIRKALGTLRPDRETLPLYHAALARSRADWLIGMNLSRLFTLLGRKAGYNGVFSVGRVQTPTLQLVVRRDRQIDQFVAQPYWAIDAKLAVGGRTFNAQWEPPKEVCDPEGRCIQQAHARSTADAMNKIRCAQVTSVRTERIREAQPLPFDLSTLQEMCSRQWGLDVQVTLDIAQSLYETHKATTYPRSDCGFLPQSMFTDAPTVLNALLAADQSLAPLLQTLDRSQRSRAWNDDNVTAHHGIIPTLEPPKLAAFSPQELQVYRLIRAHYIAQFLPAHEFDRTEVILQCSDITLRAQGRQVAVNGWRSAMDTGSTRNEDEDAASSAQHLPALSKDAPCDIAQVDLKSLKTAAPKAYTQGDLIKDMRRVHRFVADERLKQKLKDTAGIGTVATQAATIEALLARGYLRKQGRSIRSTPAGSTLIDIVPAAIADPGTTAVWEQALDLIAAGELKLDDFVAKQSAWVSQIVRDHAHTPLSIHIPTPQPESRRRAPRRSARAR